MNPEDDYARRRAERDQVIAEARDAAADMFSLYQGYVDAGFTPAQAMQLLVGLLAGSGESK